MPEFLSGEAARQAAKAVELAAFVEMMLERKPLIAPLERDQVPVVETSV